MKNANRIKAQLLTACEKIVDDRLKAINDRLDSIKDARNNETKSSVGDKYETGRSMMQMEENNSKAQLYQNNELKKVLAQLKGSQISEEIAFGSLVQTDKCFYYLSIGLGKIIIESEPYFCVSMGSPIGKLLKGKKVGETIELNGKYQKVLMVC